ncbi:hypothetical protein J5B18_004659 [Escherichia coli]|nr:hypothetical protein [Escherichia coli]
MKRKIFWICAVALGMNAFPSFMTQAAPATQPLINAEPAVAAQAEQNPQVGQVMRAGRRCASRGAERSFP